MSELFSALRISGSGMAVQRMKLNTTAENIANAETTRTQDGGPYRRREVVVTSEDRPVNFSGRIQKCSRQAGKHARESPGIDKEVPHERTKRVRCEVESPCKPCI